MLIRVQHLENTSRLSAPLRSPVSGSHSPLLGAIVTLQRYSTPVCGSAFAELAVPFGALTTILHAAAAAHIIINTASTR